MSCDSCIWGITKNSGCSFNYICNTNGREAEKKEKPVRKEKPIRDASYTQPIYTRKEKL